MKIRIVLFCLSCYIFNTSFGQEIITINKDATCSFIGESTTDEAYAFSSSEEANSIIISICDLVGLKPNFVVKVANVPNAQAQIDRISKQRMILYSQTFITSIDLITKSNWGSIATLAHELGHHLNGHTLVGYTADKKKNHIEELQADEFAGFVCYKLGATLEQAQSVFQTFAEDNTSSTHPPRSARLEAVAVGWNKAKEQVKTETQKQEPTSNTNTKKNEPPVSVPSTETNKPNNDCQTTCKFINKAGWSLLMSLDGNNYTIPIGDEIDINVRANTPIKYRVTTSDNTQWFEGQYTLNIYGTINVKECQSKTVTLTDPNKPNQKTPEWKGW